MQKGFGVNIHSLGGSGIMQNKILDLPSAVLSTLTSLSGGNLLNSTVTTLAAGGIGFTGTQPYVILKHVRLTNILSTVAAFVSLFKGATGAQVPGTAFAVTSVSIPAASYLDAFYGQARFESADYLTGLCNLPSAVVINMDGEIGLV
jgi:hypothetical protein